MHFVIHHIEKVGSTNDFAFEACSATRIEEGTVYSARKQHTGKGYHDHVWESEKGKNLTVSLVLRPGFIAPSAQFILTQIISLAVSDLLIELIQDHRIRIKWPNDVYIDKQKSCGILVQNSIVGDKIDYSVIGIGLNVNQKEFPEYLPNPVSVAAVTNREYDLDDVLNRLLQYIDIRYTGFRKNPDEKILLEEYLNRLYRYREFAAFKDKEGEYTGRITGVDNYGRLQVEMQDGPEKLYNFKEVEFI